MFLLDELIKLQTNLIRQKIYIEKYGKPLGFDREIKENKITYHFDKIDMLIEDYEQFQNLQLYLIPQKNSMKDYLKVLNFILRAETIGTLMVYKELVEQLASVITENLDMNDFIIITNYVSISDEMFNAKQLKVIKNENIKLILSSNDTKEPLNITFSTEKLRMLFLNQGIDCKCLSNGLSVRANLNRPNSFVKNKYKNSNRFLSF